MKRLLQFGSMILLAMSVQSQTSPPTKDFKPGNSPSPKYVTDTITFSPYASGTVITNQTYPKGAVFSGVGTADPVVYDYGAGSFGKILRSDTWYDPVRVDFVDTLTGTNLALVQKIELENPINSEVDYITVDVYDEFNNLLYHYNSASPEYITIDLGTPMAAYMILDDSLNTAYVVDNILLDFGNACVNTSSTITESALDSYTAPSGAQYTSSGVYYDTIPNAAGCDSVITINLTMSFTGLDNIELAGIELYPSPTLDNITLSVSKDLVESQYRIIDLSGRVVMTGKLEKEVTTIDVSSLQSGVYRVFINDSLSPKFVKK